MFADVAVETAFFGADDQPPRRQIFLRKTEDKQPEGTSLVDSIYVALQATEENVR